MVLCTSAESSIVKVLAGHATRDPNAAAIVCSRAGRVSFGDLVRYIRQVGLQLRVAGIGPTSRVGIALARGPEAAVLSVAVCCTAILVPLDPNVSTDELQAELKSLRLDALIVSGDGALPSWLSAAGEGCGLFTITNSALDSTDVALRQVRAVGSARPASPSPAHSWAAI